MINKEKTILAISTTAFLLCSCADKEPTFGEKLQSRGDEVHTIGEHWSEGDTLIKKGSKLVVTGRKDVDAGDSLVSKGKSEIIEGETSINKGNLLKGTAEADYKKRVERPVLGAKNGSRS